MIQSTVLEICLVHRVVKEVDRGEPVVVREVEKRKGSRWRRMRIAQNGMGNHRRGHVKGADQSDPSDTAR